VSEQDRKRLLVRARSELARIMFELKQVKDHSTPSDYRQVAQIILELGAIRERIEKLSK
jgi:hypothetical protein